MVRFGFRVRFKVHGFDGFEGFRVDSRTTETLNLNRTLHPEPNHEPWNP
jgi:hypothetical protein